jgi:hypothetical protein
MTLPSSGILTLADIKEEFAAPAKTQLSKFNRGGDYVPDAEVNAAINEVPPIEMASFYDASRNPTTYEHDSFLLPSGGIKVLGAQPKEGLIVAFHNESSSIVETDEKYVVDIRVRCGLDQDDGPSQSLYINPDQYEPAYPRMKFFVGVTIANPAIASDASLISGVISGRFVEFYRVPFPGGNTYQGAYGLTYTGPGASYSKTVAVMRTSDTEYIDSLIPTESRYANCRLLRGTNTDPIPGGGAFGLDHQSQFFRNEDPFSSLWETNFDDTNQTNTLPWNGGGWMILYNVPIEGGVCDLDVDFLKVSVGTTTPPW